MRLTEPARKHAILGNAVQHAIGPDDGRIYSTRKDEHAHEHDESVKRQPQPERSGQKHRNATDEVVEILAPFCIGNDHDSAE